MDLKTEILNELARTYSDEPRDSVVSVRLSRTSASNLRALGGSAVINNLLMLDSLPSLAEIGAKLCFKPKYIQKDGSEPGGMSLAATSVSAELYHSRDYFRWGSVRTKSPKVITLGMLRKMFLTKGLVNKPLIDGNLIFASSNMIDRFGSRSIAKFYKEGEMIEPWVYLGSGCFIRLYQLLYFLKSSVVDELPDTVIYSDDIRLPVIPIMPFDGDVTSDIEISNGGRIDVINSVPSKYRVRHESNSIYQLNLFGEKGYIDYSCLPFYAEAFNDMHPDLEYTEILDLEASAKVMAEESWQNRVKYLSSSSIVGVRNVMYRNDGARSKPWLIQPRLKGSRSRQYLGSYLHLNDTVYAAMQYRLVNDILDESDITIQLNLSGSKPLEPAQSYVVEWTNRFNKSQEALRSWIENCEEYDHYVKGVILYNKEKLELLLQKARQESFIPINNHPESPYSALETIYNFESRWVGELITKPFYDEKLFHLSLQGIDEGHLQDIAAAIQNGDVDDLPTLFPEYNFRDEAID